jgi:hypothetical protein
MVSARRKEVVAENRAILAKKRPAKAEPRKQKAEVVAEIVQGRYMPDCVHEMIKSSYRVIPKFDTRIAHQICDMLAAGAVINWIAEQPWFPGMRALRSWLATDADFKADYENARRTGTEVVVGAMMQIALEPATGDMAFESRRKTSIQMLQWYAERMNRKDYGQHVAMQVDTTTTVVLDPHFKEEARAALAELRATRRPAIPDGTVNIDVA